MLDLVLSNATILDPVSGGYLEGRHVAIQDGLVVEVETAPIRAGAQRSIDLAGRVLMPGLCDAHVHVTAVTADFALLGRWSPFYVSARSGEILEGMLMRGFTTVRDAGGADWGLAKAVAENVMPGPRLLYCGHALSQTGGHGDMRGPGESLEFGNCFCCAGLGVVCDGVPALRRACREEIRRGATHLKLMVSGGVASPTDRIDSTQFALEEIQAAVEEAVAANIPVMAHAYTARAINRALECGVDSIEHGNLLDQSSVDLFVRTGKFLVPTLSTYDALASEGVAAGLAPELHAKVFDVLDAGRRALELAHRGGVKMAYGTDLLGTMQRHQLREFAIRGEVQKPIDVIRSATTIAAELFRLAGKVGVIAPGAFADMLVLDGDPLADLGVLQAPERFLKAVMKGGRFYKDDLSA